MGEQVNILYENKSESIILMKTKKLSSLPHMHKEIEIIYVRKGASKTHADQIISEIGKGDIFISFPNQVDFYEKSIEGDYYVIIISPKVFFGIKDLIDTNIPTENTFNADKKLCDLFESFATSKAQNNTSKCVGYINLIFAEILNKIQLSPLVTSSEGTLREIINFCETHYAEEISLSVVAKHTHLSPCYISHLFGSKLSIGFSDYINILRANAACELFTQTSK